MNPLTQFRADLRKEVKSTRWLKMCPACHGDGCVVEKEESFSFSEFDPCTTCNCSGKVEVKI